ncbi:peroxisomal assembly protein [Coemansia sp. RSA 1813]|nr:peroxisomal assembly protein [Coemansia sp. RSA 1813]
MPSFWTSDTPLAEIKARIYVDAQTADHEPRIVRDITLDSTRLSDRDIYACRASRATWTAIAKCVDTDSLNEASIVANIEPIVPVELSEIVLGVVSDQYADALDAQDRIADYIRSRSQLYYQGHNITVRTSADISGSQDTGVSISLTCLMCQPVMQGIIRQGTNPRIVITKLPTNVPSITSQTSNVSNQVANEDMDDGQWDLGVEWFILGDIPLGSNRDKIAGAAFNDMLLTNKADTLSLDQLNKPGPAKPTQPVSVSASVPFTANMLQSPIDISQVLPSPYANEDIDNRGYISLAASAKAGIISGSWVLIKPEFKRSSSTCSLNSPGNSGISSDLDDNHKSSRWSQRAIRVFALDSIPSTSTLVLPPLLFHNVFSASGKSSQLAVQSAKRSCEARVLVTPLGFSPDAPSPAYLESIQSLAPKTKATPQPPLPVAKRVYIARISSPLSERRDLETHTLAALERWLSPLVSETSNIDDVPLRVVKEGDLIAVHVSLADAVVRTSIAKVAGTDVVNRLRDNGQEVDASAADVNPVTDLTLERPIVHCDDLHTQALVSENELVFYQVVAAEGFRRAPETYALPYSLKALDKGGSNENDEVTDSSDSESESEYDSDEEFDYALFRPVTSDNSADRKWAMWYHQVHGKGFIVLPQITMVVQAGSVHGHVPYQTVRMFSMSQMQSPCEDPASPSTDNGASTLSVPYASVQDQLVRLGNASLHPLAIAHKLVSATLLKGNAGTGKRHIIRAVADTLGVHLYELSCYDILSDTEDKTAQVLKVYFENVGRYTPCVLHLRNLEALALATNAPPGQDNSDDLPIARVFETCIADISRIHRQSGFPIIVVGTTNQADKLPTSLAAVFRHEVELSVPDEQARLSLLNSIAKGGLRLAPDVDLAYIAQQTASFVARDLTMLIKRAEKHAWRRAHRVNSKANNSYPAAVPDSTPIIIRDLALSGQAITHDDLLGALGEARASMSDTLGVPKIPNVKWDDVGGLADAKKDILDTIRLPMEQPHLFASGLNTRSGLLFYGPPGTGKTLLAKAIATECGLNFFSCKGPELISPYIGESEANVRRIFQKAREASPCVVFFDELDSLAPKRGQQGDSGGVMDRIVSQLLAELDGMSGGSGNENEDSSKSGEDGDKALSSASAVQVFAIGATNRPDLLDPALLRPGRFDKLVYLGVSETHEAQLNIIQALTRKFHLHPDLNLRKVADQCPFHYTGADFYALSSDALLKAMLRTVDEVDLLVKEWDEGKRPGSMDTESQNEGGSSDKHYPVPMTPQYYLDHIADDSVKQVTVTLDDFEKALDELIPSVSADELERYQTLRHQFDSALKEKEKDKLKTKSQQSSGDTGVGDIYEQETNASGDHFYTPLNESVSSSQQLPENDYSSVAPKASIESDSVAKMTGSKKSKGKGKEPVYYTS